VLCVVVGVPIALVSIPIVLPAAIISVIISNRRFWRLQTGDVIGTSYVVLHPPKRGYGFRILKFNKYKGFHVWNNVDKAESDMFKVLSESFMEIICPIRCTKRLPLHEVVELLMAEDTGYWSIEHDPPTGIYSFEDRYEQNMFWMQCKAFELVRPVRVIQRAWRAHAARRREAAARIITRAAIHFLYRPKGWAYEAGSCRWHKAS